MIKNYSGPQYFTQHSLLPLQSWHVAPDVDIASSSSASCRDGDVFDEPDDAVADDDDDETHYLCLCYRKWSLW